ncbi:hypothetical protein AXW67_38195 [Bradyrhizobium neotropicale]|uniref:DUF3309 domain-containing protein n=2 Tax=Nitrobacteraceae TaxID=41294 RepID=A0A176ZG04_9BRAD|nr:hypothetical protein AXW67_38195 [Bradyrhizobium neotropicale]
MEPNGGNVLFSHGGAADHRSSAAVREDAMTLGTILIILVLIYLVGGLSGRIGGYGYGMGHSGMGIGGVVLVVLVVLLLLGKI